MMQIEKICKEIINLRKRYNLSLQQFSKVIGCAKKTLISYEAGTSIPNDIYMVILKTLIDNNLTDEQFIQIVKKNGVMNNTSYVPNNQNNKPNIYNQNTDPYCPLLYIVFLDKLNTQFQHHQIFQRIQTKSSQTSQ